MATLNTSAKGRMRTTNRSGHAAYRTDDKTKLTTMALTTMLGEPKFYGDNTDELISLAESLCEGGQGEFVAKLAVWARTEGKLRSVSHALASVVAHGCGGESFIRPMARMIASMRGDDGTEMLATYKALYGKPFNHALMRGIADALGSARPFDIAKYQSASRDFKMRDTLRVTHPKASGETSEAMGECVAGTLGMPKGWETELSARGNTKEVWDELIAENRLGFFALVRNLRNMLRAGADVGPVLERVSDREAVSRSRLLPFRFYSAYRELAREGLLTTRVARALDVALAASCHNVERLPGRTAVLIDTSGSMSSSVSARSIVTCRDIAAVMGALVTRISDDAAVVQFDTSASVVPMIGLSVISDSDMVPASGGGTHMACGFDCLKLTGFDADRVVVLSDNEVNGGGWWGNGTDTVQAKMDEYRRHVGHDVWCHAIDLQGYGTQQFIGGRTNIMAGWSESVLRFIGMAEAGFGSIVSEVESLFL